MVNIRRLYLYGVMGAALVPLLWGLTSLLRLAGRGFAATIGDRDVVGGDVARDELSLAIAMVVVAVPVWVVHFWLAQRPLRGPPELAADERACPARATYFYLVLTLVGGVALLQLYAVLQELLRMTVEGHRPWGLAGAAAALIVTSMAWLGHLWWRRRDLLAAPARTADDWLTRAYVYSGLVILALLTATWIGTASAVVLGELIEARPRWDSWQEAFTGPAAGAISATIGWTAQWLTGLWLIRADPPLGDAHRASRTRSGHFLAVVLVSSAAVIALVGSSLGEVFAKLLGVWTSVETPNLAEAVGGPLVLAAPFAVAWWWHWRRAMQEALTFGGHERFDAARRSGLYVLAFVGLAGLAIGGAWAIQSLLDWAEASREAARSSILRQEASPAVATALIGLALWAPVWRLIRLDFGGDPQRVAASVPRRAYLLLVSGLAVVALMGSVALLVYHAIRVLLDVEAVRTGTWPVAVALVAASVLAYHLWRLRLDGLLVAEPSAPDTVPAEEVGSAPSVLETIEIRAPAGTDLEAVNSAIRAELPEGVEMHVLPRTSDEDDASEPT